MPGSIASSGAAAVSPQAAGALADLLRDYFSWQPSIPFTSQGTIDQQQLALLLAPLCRMVRDDVTKDLENPKSLLHGLAQDWRRLLFPQANDAEFADAYAQTVTFALLLARSSLSGQLTIASAINELAQAHGLLSRALQILTDSQLLAILGAGLQALERVIDAIPPKSLVASTQGDPWLYFYEDFLDAYDPQLRQDIGAYYTPVEVVRAQVRLIDDILITYLGKREGLLDPQVSVLDPAMGTGTYLLGIANYILSAANQLYGGGGMEPFATELIKRLYGFEILVGPYAVCELKLSQLFQSYGVQLGGYTSVKVYLNNTLDSPNAQPQQYLFFAKVLADQHAAAIKVKNSAEIMVCLGNPPYDRHGAATDENRGLTGGWVRWGDTPDDTAILDDFLAPVRASGKGGQLKNLYNLYVYFWRWALWKVFEQPAAPESGIVSFITPASFLDGEAFAGMRQHMRKLCDEIWVIDLGGEGRGTRQDENVFAIRTPVAITIAFRRATRLENAPPATVKYHSLQGSRAAKLKALDAIIDAASVQWEQAPSDWQAPFRPAGTGPFFAWPLLTDIFPWQQSGVKAGRTWVIGPTEDVLRTRLNNLFAAPTEERSPLFKDSPTGRSIHHGPLQLPPNQQRLSAIVKIENDDNESIGSIPIQRYGYRSFDRHYLVADARFIDRPGPDLWRAHGEQQVYFASSLSQTLGEGPALMASALIPDLHYFSGRGAKDIMPLYRDADGCEANIAPGLLAELSAAYGQPVSAEDLAAYVYGILAHPGYTARYAAELMSREVRVPFTADDALYAEIRDLGAKLIWLHTYGERYQQAGGRGRLQGQARALVAVPTTADAYPEDFRYDPATKELRVGAGSFGPVDPAVWEFSVSGLRVVASWLGYRMRERSGRKSSPLDAIRPPTWTFDFTKELLELLWVLEATVAIYPQLDVLLERVVAGAQVALPSLDAIPAIYRKPASASGNLSFFGAEDEDESDED